MSSIKIAIPSEHPGGLSAQLSAHFGHCDVYTIVEIDENGTKKETILDNPPHQEGGCLAPVNMLAENGVKKLLAGGMGHRPLAAFAQVGIDVYKATDGMTVGEALKALESGKLPVFSINSVCGGCGGH